jgi:hypothetical protein
LDEAQQANRDQAIASHHPAQIPDKRTKQNWTNATYNGQGFRSATLKAGKGGNPGEFVLKDRIRYNFIRQRFFFSKPVWGHC